MKVHWSLTDLQRLHPTTAKIFKLLSPLYPHNNIFFLCNYVSGTISHFGVSKYTTVVKIYLKSR